jgi:tRNA 2-selenouridine synthase
MAPLKRRAFPPPWLPLCVPKALPPQVFLGSDAPLLDVRSPAEYDRGHIPGAIPFPLFSDEERAVVGTLYKQQGRDAAVLEGLRHVGPRMATLVERARELAPAGRVRVHCWRGGERSGSVAWLLEKAGFQEVSTLTGGYKAYRNHVLGSFNTPHDLRVLGGFTGSGKTDILKELQQLGEQVLDLEALAHHKGSSFGALGQPAQPTTEQFENLVWAKLRVMDPNRHIWLEDESLMIGRVRLPDAFFLQLRSSNLLFLDLPLDYRVNRLVKEYGGFPAEQLAEAIQRIGRRLGPQHCKTALEALAAGDLHTVAGITLRYYDKAYLQGVSARHAEAVLRIAAPTDGCTSHELALLLKEHVATIA